MKKILFPIIALAAFFLFFLWLFSTRETTLNLPREALSDIFVVLYAILPVFIAVVAFFVRRLIVKGK